VTQVIGGLEIDRAYVIREGEASVREVAAKSFAWPAIGENGGMPHQHAAAAGR
jgi:hypothetical protein